MAQAFFLPELAGPRSSSSELLQQFEFDVQIAEIGTLQIPRVVGERGIEPVDQFAGRGDPRRVAAALFKQRIGLGEFGRTRQIVGEEAPHQVDAQRIIFDAGEDLAGNPRQMADAVGDLWRADRAHGDLQPYRQRLGIGQQFPREFDFAPRGAAGIQSLERFARRKWTPARRPPPG